MRDFQNAFDAALAGVDSTIQKVFSTFVSIMAV